MIFREKPYSAEIYHMAARFSVCSVAEAAQILESRPKEYSGVYGTLETPPDAHVTEYVLLRRDEPEIDLVLAKSGRSKTVLERVYKRGNDAIKTVACSNPSLFVGERFFSDTYFGKQRASMFWEVLKNGSRAQLKALCQIPDLRVGMYTALIESWARHPSARIADNDRILDERFLDVIRFLWTNKRLETSYYDSRMKYYLDGLNEYDYFSFERECWRVAEIAPVTVQWSHALARLFGRLQPYPNAFDDVEAVLERWRLVGEKEYGLREIRTAIAEKFFSPSLEMLSSSDPAI